MITKFYVADTRNSVSFGRHYINVDMGASKQNVSCKLRIMNEKGDCIARKDTTVFKDGDDRSTSTFEKNVAKLIAGFDKSKRKDIINNTEQNKPYEPVVTVCCPGPPVLARDENGRIYEGNSLPNVKDNSGKPLSRPINGKNIADDIRKRLSKDGIELYSYLQAKDTDATGVLVLETLKQENQELLKDGRVILHLYPGGGLANGTIRVSKDRYIIEGTEKPSIFEQTIGKPAIDKKDRSAVGLLENFCKELGIDSKFFNGDTRVVTDYEYYKSLNDKGFYRREEDYKRASWYAIEKMMNALACITQIEICNGKTDTVVLVGPAVNGAKKAVDELIKSGYLKDRYPEAAHFEDIFQSKVYSISHDIRGKLAGFNLQIKFLDVKDNTIYAHKLQDATVVGSPAGWYEIPKEKKDPQFLAIG